MAVFTKKKFAEDCGITTKDLAVYIGRGKVVLTVDKFIDGDIEDNKNFLEKRKEYKKLHPNENVVLPSEEKALNNRSAKQIKSPQAKFDFPPDITATENYKIDTKIKQQELEEIQFKNALLKSKLEKISGNSIPTELVKNLISNHSKSITIAFKNGAENLLTEVSKKKGLDRVEIADLKTKLTEIINAAVSSSIDESKKMVKNIVFEYSHKREQGEKE